MGDLIIKPASSGNLKIQSDSATNVLTVGTDDSVTLGTEFKVTSTSQTFTIKGIDAAITDSQTGADPNVADSDSGQLAIYNGSTKLWGISEHGYVVNPKLPYFKARKSTAISSTGYVTFNTVIYNTESFYNASNGYATAPIDGLYQFFCKINALGRIDFQFRINGGGGTESTYAEIGQYNSSNASDHFSNLLASPLYLNAGDYVQVYVSTLMNNTDSGVWTHFSGYLLG